MPWAPELPRRGDLRCKGRCGNSKSQITNPKPACRRPGKSQITNHKSQTRLPAARQIPNHKSQTNSNSQIQITSVQNIFCNTILVLIINQITFIFHDNPKLSLKLCLSPNRGLPYTSETRMASMNWTSKPFDNYQKWKRPHYLIGHRMRKMTIVLFPCILKIITSTDQIRAAGPRRFCLDPDCKRPGPDVAMLQIVKRNKRYARQE